MIDLKHGDCLELIKDIKSESVDCILTDPPYKYLKNQKLEVDFNELLFFNEAKRVLKKTGFIILFGRGPSFYRWNTLLNDMGFNFKEEIVWNKGYTSSPVHPLLRVHETISIHGLAKSKINVSRIPYIEIKDNNIKSIQQDINRIKSSLSNTKILDDLSSYLEGNINYNQGRVKGYSTTVHGVVTQQNQATATLRAINEGMKEKTIISINRDHYASIHPTQKPVRLLERLLAITTKQGDLVIDAFAGSFSTGEACYNTYRDCIGFELDLEYFNNGNNRIKEVMKVQRQKQLSFADEVE